MGIFQYYSTVLVVTLTVAAGMVGSVSDKDREECAEQLVGLATCLPYVGGDAKSPTPDCCNGLKQVVENDKKCLCVIVVDRNDPQLGLKINVTLALSLPSVCHASANVSQCPELLHLPPNSKDAQVFYQFSKNSNQNATSPALSPTVERKPASGQSAQKISSGSSTSGKAWFGILEIVSLLFLFFTIMY